jgi:BON domain-containing protein
MRSLMHYFSRLISALAIGSCFFGMTPSGYGQQGSQVFSNLHSAQLQPSRFVYGAEAFARPINPVVPLSTTFPSSAYIVGAPAPTTQGFQTGVAQSNVFAPFYANPLAGSRPSPFGAPLYDFSRTTNTFMTPAASNLAPPQMPAASISPADSLPITTAPDSATLVIGTPSNGTTSRPRVRVQVPTLTLPTDGRTTEPTPAANALQPRDDLQQIISRSSALSPRDAIRVVGSGSEIILRGSVISDYDRRLAEALLLLSPGVQSVRNELTVGQ